MHPADGLTVYIRQITETGELKGIYLSDSRRAGTRTTYTAARALLVRSETGPKLVMVEGLAQIYDRESGRLSTTRFSDFAYDLAGLIAGAGAGLTDPRELATATLLAPDEAVLAATGKPASVLLYEAHARFAQPFLGLVGALLGFGALLSGGFSRLGLWRQIALACTVLVALQLLDSAVADRALADARFLPVVYLPVAAGLAAAAGFLAWAGRWRQRPGRGAARAGTAA
jgi:lipopolysaccharide export system permease protein